VRTAVLLAIAAIISGSAPNVNAVDAGRLPAVAVVAADGTTVASAALAQPNHWALIYVPTECGGCGSLLRLVTREDHPGMPQRVAVVVAGVNAEAVRVARQQFPDLAEANWFADPLRAFATSLQLGTTPAVIGMNGNSVEWTLTGVLAASSDVKSAIERWLEQ